MQFVVYNDTDTSKHALNITVSYTWDCLLDQFSAAVIQDVENCFCFVFCTYFVKYGVRTCQNSECSFPLNKYVRLEFVFIKLSHN